MSVHIGGICIICSPSLSFSLQPVPPSLSLASFSSVTGHLMFNKNANAVALPYLLIFTNIHVYGSSHQPSPGSFLTPGQMTPGFTAVFPKWVCSVYDSQYQNRKQPGGWKQWSYPSLVQTKPQQLLTEGLWEGHLPPHAWGWTCYFPWLAWGTGEMICTKA